MSASCKHPPEQPRRHAAGCNTQHCPQGTWSKGVCRCRPHVLTMPVHSPAACAGEVGAAPQRGLLPAQVEAYHALCQQAAEDSVQIMVRLRSAADQLGRCWSGVQLQRSCLAPDACTHQCRQERLQLHAQQLRQQACNRVQGRQPGHHIQVLAALDVNLLLPRLPSCTAAGPACASLPCRPELV